MCNISVPFHPTEALWLLIQLQGMQQERLLLLALQARLNRMV
jgi:hypothetical protein